MQKTLSFVIHLFFIQFGFAQEISAPSQPALGPGGADYVHDSITIYDFAETPEGYWLYEPACPTPDTANVVVFLHGYGAYNPMIYGGWIRHLVRKGNIVIFPRYQKNIFSPSPKKFVAYAAEGIRDALTELEKEGHVKPITDNISLVGHSYGGVISANLAVNFAELQIPFPHAVMLCSPGTGPFDGGLMESYADMLADTKLIVLVNEHDRTVGDKIGKLVFETAEKVKNRNLLRQFRDKYGHPEITASHNESYALDEYFDSGDRNISTLRARRKGSTDAMDFYGYWKLFDALLDCARYDENCHFALGNTPQQRYLGAWSDGTPIKEMEVLLPETQTTSDGLNATGASR